MPARTGNMKKGHANFYEHGDNNVIDDRTGFKRKASQCEFEWNGFFVGKDQWEERHPQDFLRGFPDRQQPNVSRPGTGILFIETTDPVNPGDF